MSCWYFTSIPHAIVTVPLVSWHLILSECKNRLFSFLILTVSSIIIITMVHFITLSQDTLILTSDFGDGEISTQNNEVALWGLEWKKKESRTSQTLWSLPGITQRRLTILITLPWFAPSDTAHAHFQGSIASSPWSWDLNPTDTASAQLCNPLGGDSLTGSLNKGKVTPIEAREKDAPLESWGCGPPTWGSVVGEEGAQQFSIRCGHIHTRAMTHHVWHVAHASPYPWDVHHIQMLGIHMHCGSMISIIKKCIKCITSLWNIHNYLMKLTVYTKHVEINPINKTYLIS